MKKVSLLLTFSFIMALWIAPAAPAQSQEAQPASLLATMQADTGGRTVIEYHAETGMARFIGTDPNHPIPLDKTVFGENVAAEQAAMHFLASYGSLFGLADPAEDLRLRRTTSGEDGGTYLRYQQVYRGIPVFAGELVVGTTSSKAVASASGEALPGIDLDIEPAVDAETARRTALQKTARIYELDPEELVAGQPELWIYNPALLGGPGMRVTSLVWRVEVEPLDLSPIRELVLVDAHRGIVLLHFNRNPGALDRLIYDNYGAGTTLPGTLARIEGGATSSVSDVNQAYDFLGDTYNFYDSIHGRDSIDGNGMKLIATVRHCTPLECPYSNAYWSGLQMVFGEGYASADDVVAHELTHGVTQYESDLAYYMQSGAINESLSDIWGEFVDLKNNLSTPESDPWMIGEDLPIGAIRNMKDPTNPPNVCIDTQTTGCNRAQPDRMTSSYYYCGTKDHGGVHINSGVGNKAAYLMAAGGSFNGKVVTGIGIEKTAKIWYHVQTNMLTSGSDYQDLYSALIQACTTLVGTSGITTSNCQQVKNAVDAVQMNLQPTCSSSTTQKVYLPITRKAVTSSSLPTTFTSVGDACVLQGYASINYGDTVDMWAGYDDYLDPNGQIARSMIRFDLSIIPAGKAISSATLKVYHYSYYDFPYEVRLITAYRISSPWTESAVTWNSQPSFAEAYGSVSIPAGQWGYYRLDVTNLVKSWIKRTLPNHGVMLRGPEISGSDSSWRGFYTREGDYSPTLEIIYTSAGISSEGDFTGTVDQSVLSDSPTITGLLLENSSEQQECRESGKCFLTSE